MGSPRAGNTSQGGEKSRGSKSLVGQLMELSGKAGVRHPAGLWLHGLGGRGGVEQESGLHPTEGLPGRSAGRRGGLGGWRGTQASAVG